MASSLALRAGVPHPAPGVTHGAVLGGPCRAPSVAIKPGSLPPGQAPWKWCNQLVGWVPAPSCPISCLGFSPLWFDCPLRHLYCSVRSSGTSSDQFYPLEGNFRSWAGALRRRRCVNTQHKTKTSGVGRDPGPTQLCPCDAFAKWWQQPPGRVQTGWGASRKRNQPV